MKKTKVQENVKVERFNPDVNAGLSSMQVSTRLTEGKVNSVKKKYSKSYASIFMGNIFTFFNLLGLIVAVALIVCGAKFSDFFFVLIYLANILIGIILEIRAKRCIDKLSLVSSKSIKVIRDGKEEEISSFDLVLDDVYKLSLGSQIPADSIILDGEVYVNESLLTGESIAIKKSNGDKLFAGSFITSGNCLALCDKVGKDNYVEQLSEKAKSYRKPRSPLMNSLHFIIKMIGIIIVPIAAAFIIKSLHFNATPIDAISKTSTLVIGMIPSGMFLLTSMALAVGVIKLYKHNTLVQDLYSLEMLARVDTICFDKTGTITDGRMTVNEIIDLDDADTTDIPQIVSSMLYFLNDNNPTATALNDYFGKEKFFEGTKIIHFNSSNKLSAVTFEGKGTYAFGAPEFILDSENYKKIESKINHYAAKGLRVLLIAHSNGNIENDKPPKNFTPSALILIMDNIREDAISTVSWFKENDVNIKVISGDNPITVSEVAKRAGILNAEKYISLEHLSDNDIINVANEYTVFGRVTPEQKALLIKSIKSAGHTTAMTGDGVNDILALKEADCAISVASGSDAARNISHLVLMDNNFASMPKIVHEGRRVINNVQSSASLYLMKTLFTMLLAIITLCIPLWTTYPFKLSQMILLEVFVIGLPSFFLSFQPNDSRVKGSFLAYVLKRSLPSAILMLINVIVILIFKNALGLVGKGIYTDEVYSTLAAYALTFGGLVSLFIVCRPLNKYRAVLFFTNLIIVLGISIYGVLCGLDALSLVKLVPLSEFWHHILIVVGLVLLDLPLSVLIQKLCSKIKFKKLDKKLTEREEKEINK